MKGDKGTKKDNGLHRMKSDKCKGIKEKIL